MGKILTSKQFEEDLKKLHPFSNFTILEYNGMSKPLKILCLDCNKILDFSRAEKAKTTINLCEEKHFYSQKDKAEFFSKQYGFEILEWNTERKRYAKILCKKCGSIYFRHHTHIITNPSFCPECSVKCESQKLTLEQAQEKIDDIFGKENFNLLEYVSYHEKALIKHNCGFTWSIRFSDFLKSRGCPKCHKNKSKGEQKIEEWLTINNIDFIAQYPLLPPLNRFKFDFFLTKIKYCN